MGVASVVDFPIGFPIEYEARGNSGLTVMGDALAAQPTLPDPRPRPDTPKAASESGAASALDNKAAFGRNATLPTIDAPLHCAADLESQIDQQPHAGGAALHLRTDLFPYFAAAARPSDSTPSSNPEIPAPSAIHASASAPIAIPLVSLRHNASTASLASSHSPSSALPSPALAALAELTPFPSPLIGSDSPGPWTRARTTGQDESMGLQRRMDPGNSSNGTTVPLSPNSPSKRRKGYNSLVSAATEQAASFHASQQQNKSNHGRNRSISDFTPETMHNLRPRHMTLSSAPDGLAVAMAPSEYHIHREEYLAAQRGLTRATAIDPVNALPTPPASNTSVAESEDGEEELNFDDSSIDYLVVRTGPEKRKRKWRPVRMLGQGTFSKVMLATKERLAPDSDLEESRLDPRKLVAIKIVEHGPAGGADEERIEVSLKREVEMLQSVSHPSIIHLKAFDCTDERALLVLTYCPGGDLFDLATEHREILTQKMVQRMFAELVGAVRYLHTNMIVHRDIKLENVLVNLRPHQLAPLTEPATHPTPLLTLTDLGLSRRIPAPPASPLLTTRCGSEDYAAPEILLGQ
ncbi:hypothetical protein LTR66_013281, partial [Elasticomyces elasticus]